MRKFFREPLVHFSALALVIFLAYGALNKASPVSPDQIVVTQATIEQTAALFARTWRRPPSPDELKGLIDEYVKEEIYYREALALGLDTNDTVIRRRLRQKMEFLNDAGVELLSPTDAELEQYLQARSAKFAVDPEITFRQVYVDPKKRGDRAADEADAIIAALRSSPSPDPASLGDATLLPYELASSSQASIGATFGAEFAEAVANTKPGSWSGPIKSPFGLHVVRVSEVKTQHPPTLAEVRQAVAREWANDKHKELAEQRYEGLLERYQVTIENTLKSSAHTSVGP